MSLTKTINVTSYLTLGIAAVMMLYLGCLLWWPVKIFESRGVTTDRMEYYPGDELIYIDDRCKYLAAPATIDITLADGIIYQYARRERNSPVGCQKVTSQPVLIPPYAVPGIYHIEAIITFEVNQLRKESFIVKSNEFEVLAVPEYE